MHRRISVHFAGGALQDLDAEPLGKSQHIDRAVDAGFDRLHRVALIMDGRCRTGKVVNFEYAGYNSRIDEFQAAVLAAKLPHLDEDNRHRADIAELYYRGITNPLVRLPRYMPAENNVYHLFPVFCEERDRLQQHLKEQGIETLIHYPIAPHQQECCREYAHLSLPVTEEIHRTELSLPIGPAMTLEEAQRVVEAVNGFVL